MSTAAFDRSAIRHHSPLRYPGGKAKLATVVKEVFRANKLLDGVYAEPYAGGAGIALTLLYEEFASRVLINDLDRAVFAFWTAVLTETEAFCRLIADTRVTPHNWHRQRTVYMNPRRASLLELGFAAFFLNRTNRSGIIGSAGMIGGQDQKGAWKIGARFHSGNLIARVERVARYRDRICVSNLDAADFLRRCALDLPRQSLVYLDPPYYIKGQQRLYANYYEDDDHEEIAETLKSMPFEWIVSYDDEPEIRDLYLGRRSVTYNLRYTAATREHGSEVMFFSNSLKLPTRLGVDAPTTHGRRSMERR